MADYDTFNHPKDIDGASASDPIAGPLADMLSHLVSAREIWDMVQTKKIAAGVLPFGMTTTTDDAFLVAWALIRTVAATTTKPIDSAIYQCQQALRQIASPTPD